MEAQAWELASIEDAIERFWDGFFPQRPEFRAFALNHADQFPQNYISLLIARLDQIGWTRRIDPRYEMPRRMMQRLASLVSKVEEFGEDYLSFIREEERKLEVEKKRQEYLLKRQEKDAVEKAEKKKARDENKRKNKAAKQLKEMRKRKNLMARVGVQSLGLV